MQAGSKVLETSFSWIKWENAILEDNEDSYMLYDCKPENNFIIIMLGEDILITNIMLLNKEFYSKSIKEFYIEGSLTMNTSQLSWKNIGNFTATNVKDWQSFTPSKIWIRFLKINIQTHYGDSSICTINQIKIFGETMLSDIKKEPIINFEQDIGIIDPFEEIISQQPHNQTEYFNSQQSNYTLTFLNENLIITNLSQFQTKNQSDQDNKILITQTNDQKQIIQNKINQKTDYNHAKMLFIKPQLKHNNSDMTQLTPWVERHNQEKKKQYQTQHQLYVLKQKLNQQFNDQESILKQYSKNIQILERNQHVLQKFIAAQESYNFNQEIQNNQQNQQMHYFYNENLHIKNSIKIQDQIQDQRQIELQREIKNQYQMLNRRLDQLNSWGFLWQSIIVQIVLSILFKLIYNLFKPISQKVKDDQNLINQFKNYQLKNGNKQNNQDKKLKRNKSQKKLIGNNQTKKDFCFEKSSKAHSLYNFKNYI